MIRFNMLAAVALLVSIGMVFSSRSRPSYKHTIKDEPGSFDYYVFAYSWTPEFCYDSGMTMRFIPKLLMLLKYGFIGIPSLRCIEYVYTALLIQDILVVKIRKASGVRILLYMGCGLSIYLEATQHRAPMSLLTPMFPTILVGAQ